MQSSLSSPQGIMQCSRKLTHETWSFFFFKSESCQVPSEVYGITNECYGEYSITGDDKNDYTPGWNITKYATKISWDDMPWRYQNSTQLDGYPFWAKLTTYGGAG